MDRIESAIRFYGRSRGRALGCSQSHLMQTLLPKIALDLERVPQGLGSCFEDETQAVWMEIGFGAGEHLVHQMQANPDIAFIGCEAYQNGVAHILRALPPECQSRLRIFPWDVRLLCPVLPERAISRIFILFPDPWPKARHHKRRLINNHFVTELARVLKKGGQVFLASDDPIYIDVMLRVFQGCQSFQQIAGVSSPIPGTWPRFPWFVTRYCKRAQAHSKPCAHIIFSKK